MSGEWECGVLAAGSGGTALSTGAGIVAFATMGVVGLGVNAGATAVGLAGQAEGDALTAEAAFSCGACVATFTAVGSAAV